MSFIKVDLPNIDKKTYRNCIVLFFALCFLIYGKSISNFYSLDDEFVMVNNAQIKKGISAIPEIFRTTYAIGEKSSYEYRPIVKVTYAIEYQLFGQNPHISHFINILLYFLSIWILFYFLLKLFKNYHFLFALVVCLFFLIHPLHSEVVMSLKNRDALLSFLFSIICLSFYMRFAEGRSWINLFWGFLFLLIANMSKRDAMTFVAIIPFTIWFFGTVNWKRLAIIAGTFVITFICYQLMAKNVVNDVSRQMLEWENPLFFDTTLFERIPEGFYCVYFYFKMFVIPHPLICYYGYDQVPIVGWSHPIVWITAVALGTAVYFIVKNFKSRAVWVYGVVYALVTISMFTNVVKPVVGIVGERFAYIPSLGMCIVAGYLLLAAFKIPMEKADLKLKGLANNFWIVLGVITIVYGGRTFARNPAWKDAYTLYSTDIKNATESAHTHSLVAAAAIANVRTNPKISREEKRRLVYEAEEHYLEAIRIIPNYISCHNNIGMVYYTYLGNPDKAIPHLRKAVMLDTNYVEAYFNLATCLAAKKQYDEAEKFYLKTIHLNPKFYATYSSLSAMYAFNKQYDKILRVNQEAIDKGIESDSPYINIGNVYYVQGDTIKSLPYLEKAIQINSNNRTLNSFLAGYYQRKGDISKASHYYDLMSRSSQ